MALCSKGRRHQKRIRSRLRPHGFELKEFMSKVDDTREVLDNTRRGLEDANKRTIELERKADDAHDRTRSHRERCRRATKDHVMAEEVLNNSLGCLCDLVKNTASATHALSCGVPDGQQ